MPIVTSQITREESKVGRHAAMAEGKATLIEAASRLLREVLDKLLDATFVVIEEVEMDNWGVGGLSVAEYRRRQEPVTTCGRSR